MRGGKGGSLLGVSGAPMSPMIDEEETGDVIKRTVVGGKKEFMDSIKVRMAQNQKTDYMTTPGGAMMSSNTLTHQDTVTSYRSKQRALSEIRGGGWNQQRGSNDPNSY